MTPFAIPIPIIAGLPPAAAGSLISIGWPGGAGPVDLAAGLVALAWATVGVLIARRFNAPPRPSRPAVAPSAHEGLKDAA
jgi:hypothetical protein